MRLRATKRGKSSNAGLEAKRRENTMARGSNGALSLSFLVYPSEDNPERFVAHCLQLDIVAVESTISEALLLLKELVQDQFEAATADGTLENIFQPAPSKYWRMLYEAVPYKPPRNVEMHHIKGPSLRRVEYAEATG
jgi:hypothetical protein